MLQYMTSFSSKSCVKCTNKKARNSITKIKSLTVAITTTKYLTTLKTARCIHQWWGVLVNTQSQFKETTLSSYQVERETKHTYMSIQHLGLITPSESTTIYLLGAVHNTDTNRTIRLIQRAFVLIICTYRQLFYLFKLTISNELERLIFFFYLLPLITFSSRYIVQFVILCIMEQELSTNPSGLLQPSIYHLWFKKDCIPLNRKANSYGLYTVRTCLWLDCSSA